MAIGSLFFASLVAAMNVLMGVAIALTNFWLLEQLVKRMASQKKKSFIRLILIFIAKLAVLFGVIGFVVLKVPIQVIPFLLGLSAVVMGIVLQGIMDLLFSQQDLA